MCESGACWEWYKPGGRSTFVRAWCTYVTGCVCGTCTCVPSCVCGTYPCVPGCVCGTCTCVPGCVCGTRACVPGCLCDKGGRNPSRALHVRRVSWECAAHIRVASTGGSAG